MGASTQRGRTAGTYREPSTAPIVQLRKRSLHHTASWPEPEFSSRDRGLALIRGVSPDAGSLVRFAQGLGEVRPVGDASPFLADRADGPALHVRQDRGPVDGWANERLFSESALPFHSEWSHRRIADQPRLVLLACLAAPADAGGDTLVASTAEVLNALSVEDSEVLRRLQIGGGDEAPTVISPVDPPVLSIRDPDGTPVRWRGDDRMDEAEVARAIGQLLTAIYQADLRAHRWRAGDLLVLDNTRWLHARTATRRRPSDPVRHLLKVLVGRGCDDSR